MLEQLRKQLYANREAEAKAAPRAQARAPQEREAMIDELRRALASARRDVERLLRRAEQAELRLSARPAFADPSEAAAPPIATASSLSERAVLCVGGRAASVPVYRSLVEQAGGRFLHHDGGAENRLGLLDAALEAADLVICQSGCVSHGAYWRVKDHCKRTGKRCVFVAVPSRAAMVRAIGEVGSPSVEADSPSEEEVVT